MKILKWRIFSLARAEKIATLIGEVPEDREIAKEFLLGNKHKLSKGYPKYRIKVSKGRIQRQSRGSFFSLWYTDQHDYYSSAQSKSDFIKRYSDTIQALIQRDKFTNTKKYTINF